MRAIIFVSTVENPEEPVCVLGQTLECVSDNEIVNDFDLIAVEAAVQLKESGDLDEVVVFGVGTERSHLQKCMAMGADRAVLAVCDRSEVTAEDVVMTAISAFKDDDISETLWLLGKLGVNFEGHRTAQRLAVCLGLPCLEAVNAIQRDGDVWHVTCESANGTPVFDVSGSFVMTADLRLATPRFPSLPNIVRSRKKPVAEILPSFGKQEMSLKTVGLEVASVGQRDCRMTDVSGICREILNMP